MNHLETSSALPQISLSYAQDEKYVFDCLDMLKGSYVLYLLSLKASRTLSKIDDIAGVDDDYGHFLLGLVSLMTFQIV